MGVIEVSGHRGACGYRPENTLESFELAFNQGVTAVECDLVPTKDGVLVIRHENWLSGTTDVASRPEFADRKREGTVGWQQTKMDWFIEDFTLAEVQTLRATERLPEIRPGSAKFDGQFKIPTLEDLLSAPFVSGKHLILEVKHGAHFAKLGYPVAAILAKDLANSNWQERGITLTIESFDGKVLDQLKRVCGDIAKYVFLVESWGMPADGDAGWAAWLDDLADRFDGVSMEAKLLFQEKTAANQNAQFGAPNALVGMIHDRGMLAFTWTARAEEAEYSIEEYFAHFISLGVDGIFADQPDLLVDVVAGLA